MIQERNRVPIREVKRQLYEVKKVRIGDDPDLFAKRIRERPGPAGAVPVYWDRHMDTRQVSVRQAASGAFFDIRQHLTAKERRIWERMPETKKQRIIRRAAIEAGRKEDYKAGMEGEDIYETDSQYVHAGVPGEEEVRKGEGLPYKGASAFAEMGRRKRQDAEGAFAPSEADTAVGGYQKHLPFVNEKAGPSVRGSGSPLVIAGSGAQMASPAADVSSGGVTAAARYGVRAIKKAADLIRRSVGQKEAAKRETAGRFFSAQSAQIGGGEISSSYASGAAGILVRFAAAAVAAAALFVQAMLMPLLAIVMIAVILVSTLFSTIAAAFTVFAAPGDISYLKWAVEIAEDDSHGYSQAARTGPDYDCSSFVWYALTGAGYDLGGYPFATGSMPGILAAAGFEQLAYTGMEDLMPGDILWVHGDAAQHTEMYMGEGLLVGASGDLDGGLPGDQSGTGQEVRVGGFYDDGWMGVFRSTSVGIGDIAIPASYEGYDVGTIYTCTPHYGTWGWVYNQARVHAAWIEAGSVYSENVAMIDDKYLIACTETFGKVGDWVTFYFENGEAIECIIADAKSPGDPNWTPWGHIHGMQIDVIEAETNLTINPGTPGCVEWWGGRRVVSATNHGAFI